MKYHTSVYVRCLDRHISYILTFRAGDVTKGRSATVTFRDPATADKVMHAHQEECLAVDGCQLTLRFGASTHLKKESNTLFVGNIDPEGDEARIRAMFETFGTIRAVRFGTFVFRLFNDRQPDCSFRTGTKSVLRRVRVCQGCSLGRGGARAHRAARRSTTSAHQLRSAARAV